MHTSLPMMAQPTWLANVSASTVAETSFPLHDILRNSLYYPSSGFDGDPVKHFAGNVLSFVYVDYGRSRDDLDAQLASPGFSGYDVAARRDVTERELTPDGWIPSPPTQADGDPSRYRDWMKQPFCSWTVMQRRAGVPDAHGPPRFSLLYLCADGAAAFQALYVANRALPRFLAVIQPGHAFGGNWTDFTDPSKSLGRSVLNNPAGVPEFLVYGGFGGRDFYREPCWPI